MHRSPEIELENDVVMPPPTDISRMSISSRSKRYSSIYKSNTSENDYEPPQIIGESLVSNDDDPEKLLKKLRVYSASVLGTSIFFWLWALYNTYHLRSGSGGGFDLGVFSFFGSGVSSALLLCTLKPCDCCGRKGVDKEDKVDNGIRTPNKTMDRVQSHAQPGQCLRAFVVLTHLTVAANYMLGILFAFTAGPRIYVYFATYCVIFALLWLIVAYAGCLLMRLYRESVRRVYGEDINPPFSLMRSALVALTNLSEIQRRYDEDEEEVDVNEELRSLYEGSGSYSNNR